MTKGDDSAWRMFHEAYFDRLWRYLLVVAAGNEETARESLQATLVRVARHIKTFADETAFWNWLTVLARSACRDETKKHRRYFSFLSRFTRQADVEHEAQQNPDGDPLNTLLEQHVALLPPDEQKLIEEKYFEHRAVRDIARDLQTTEKAVESKLSRIRRKLKEAVLAEMKKDEPRP